MFSSQIWSMLGLCWSRHHSLPYHRSSLQVSFYKNLPLAGVLLKEMCQNLISIQSFMIFFRPDTCYSSAHDTDASLTIDKYYDQVKMATNMMTK